MSDPVLDAHRREDYIYVLSGPRPISIRDQMLRGMLLVQRMIEAGILDENKSLLIVGAGIGGATAAVEAARSGIETLLIEQHDAPFMTLAAARSRHIDPTQYDWPLDHWHEGQFPWAMSHLAVPFAFQPNTADRLAAIWTNTLLQEVGAPHGKLTFRSGESIAPNGIRADPWVFALPLEVGFVSGQVQHFAAILWAAGFGEEDCCILGPPPSPTLLYEGIPFWNTDSFGDLRSVVATPNVLISGGGDGALQDFLRITTGKQTAKEIYIHSGIADSPIIHMLQSAEDRAHRGLSWANSEDRSVRDKHELPYLFELRDIHTVAVAIALADPNVRTALDLLLSNPIPVRVACRGPVLTPYYGLNRFLALLIAEYIQQKSGRNTFFFDTTITNVVATGSAPHVCVQFDQLKGRLAATGNYAPLSNNMNAVLVDPLCFGKDHEVTFESPGRTWNETFNVIIVRHGRGQLAAPPGSTTTRELPPRPRHLWPYHIPH